MLSSFDNLTFIIRRIYLIWISKRVIFLTTTLETYSAKFSTEGNKRKLLYKPIDGRMLPKEKQV